MPTWPTHNANAKPNSRNEGLMIRQHALLRSPIVRAGPHMGNDAHLLGNPADVLRVRSDRGTQVEPLSKQVPVAQRCIIATSSLLCVLRARNPWLAWHGASDQIGCRMCTPMALGLAHHTGTCSRPHPYAPRNAQPCDATGASSAKAAKALLSLHDSTQPLRNRFDALTL